MANDRAMKGHPLSSLSSILSSMMEYETPKVVTVHNPSIGLLRRGLQLCVVLYVALYQLWYAQGYQEFAGMESSVTTKVKGYSQSTLGSARPSVPPNIRMMYERVWDEADYVVPPAENGAFFVTTNVVITPNQTWGECPEDPGELPQSICNVEDLNTQQSSNCTARRNLVKSHGPQTGRCIPTDKPHKYGNITVCEIQSWCPVEDDRLVLGKDRPLITGSENHTVFIKNSIRFSYFGERFHRNNMASHVCLYNFTDPTTWLCNIFKLGDIVAAAGGNYSTLAVTGGVVAVHIEWSCNLDFDFLTNCLPKYNFRLLDSEGWNFRHAHFHEEGRRTLYKAYGVKFVIIVQGRAGKFDLKNTVINIVAGLGLLSFITMFCDFILLNYVSERKIIKEKKYEVLDKKKVFSGLLTIMSFSNASKEESQSRETLASDFCYLECSKSKKNNHNPQQKLRVSNEKQKNGRSSSGCFTVCNGNCECKVACDRGTQDEVDKILTEEGDDTVYSDKHCDDYNLQIISQV